MKLLPEDHVHKVYYQIIQSEVIHEASARRSCTQSVLSNYRVRGDTCIDTVAGAKRSHTSHFCSIGLSRWWISVNLMFCCECGIKVNHMQSYKSVILGMQILWIILKVAVLNIAMSS